MLFACRILCHVEAIQQPWSVMKAQRQLLASQAVRYRQEDIGRLCLLVEENQRLRHQLTTMSASMGGGRGDDERVGVLEAENGRLRQQMTSLEERLEEVERAKLAVAEETEAMVRREVSDSISLIFLVLFVVWNWSEILCPNHFLCFCGFETIGGRKITVLIFFIGFSICL